MNKRLFRQRGQAIVEHIILWPSLVLLTLGALQLGFWYKAKATLNDATFRAAREGALNYAYKNPMRRKFVEAMTPLYQKRGAGLTNYGIARTLAAADNGINPITGAKLFVSSLNVEIVTPTKDVFRRFSKDMWSLDPEDCERDIQSNNRGNDFTRCNQDVRFRQMPNDNLNIRPAGFQRVDVQGEQVDMNLQDANLLKIRAHWCAPMEVPLSGSLFYAAGSMLNTWRLNFWEFYGLSGGSSHDHWPACRNKTARSIARERVDGTPRIYYIPMSSDAIVRMQTPVRCEGDPRRGNVNNCTNLED